MKTIKIRTETREMFMDVTGRVAEIVAASGVVSGLAHVFVPHTTAAVTINENADPDVVGDMLTHLGKMIPLHGAFRHSEGNSDAHIKASLMGFSVTVPIHEGRLALGTWQGVYFTEFDGPRHRNLQITIIKDGFD